LRPSSSLTETLVLAPVAEAWAVSEGLAACKAEACQVAEVSVEETDEVGTMDPAVGAVVALVEAVALAVAAALAVAVALVEAVALVGEVAEASSRCSSSLIQYFR